MRYPEFMLKIHHLLGLFQKLVATQVGGDLFEVNRTDALDAVQGGFDLARFKGGFNLELGLLGLEGLDFTRQVGRLLVVGELELLSGTFVLCCFYCPIHG